jgi:D-inositol-3-phosphate glycosyltransferase
VKIALVSEHASPLAVLDGRLGGSEAGGQNVHVAALAGALADRGHQVVVYTRREFPDQPASVAMRPGVDVVHVQAGPARPVPRDELAPLMPEFGDRLRHAWKAWRPHVVHGHFWMSGVAAMPAAHSLDLPYLQTFHALGTVKRRHQPEADTSPAARLPAEQLLARRADAVIATCSDEVCELILMGAARADIEVVPCGVDLAAFTPRGPAWPRTERGRVVCVGRMVERKGLDTVILALALLSRGGTARSEDRSGDLELVIAGGPSRAELTRDPEVRRLLTVARDAGVAERVRFTGRIGRSQVPALLRSADAVVSVPWYEPFGIVPVEAMACGRPVIASAVGGMLDTVLDGVTGVHVPPRRPDRLADALLRLTTDPARAAEMGRAGALLAAERYGWPGVAAATERIYLRTRDRATWPRPAIIGGQEMIGEVAG